MRNLKCLSFLAAVFTAVVVTGSVWASTINIPEIAGTLPVIDGKISPGEWDSTSASLICMSSSEDFASPYGRFHLGRQGNNLYILFVTDTMERMPVSTATGRDGKVWEDDAFEIFLKTGDTLYQLIVNSTGVIYDRKDADVGWNGQWKVATSLIGSDFAVGYAGGERAKRGFIVELMLPMDQSGLALPKDGDQWGMQVVLDQVQINPQAVWQPVGEVLISNSPLGKVVWGGPVNRLEDVIMQEDGRLVKIDAIFGEKTACAVANKATKSIVQTLSWAGPIADTISLPGGSTYSFDIKSDQNFELTFPVTAKLRVSIAAVPAPSKESFFVTCDPARLGKGKRFPIELSIVRGEQTLWSGKLDTPTLKQRKSFWVSYKGWEPGSAQLAIREVQPGGKMVDVGRIDLTVPSSVPAWVGFKLPEMPAVPSPWTPVKASKSAASVWGRKYSFGKSPFLDQVNSVGSDILASPVALRGTVNGKRLVWKMKSWRLVSAAKDKAVYAGAATASGLKISVKTTIEFDGVTRFDWRLEPTGKKCVVRNLAFVVPVKRSVAKSFMQWPLQRYSFNDQTSWNKSGDVTSAGFHCEFTPFFWLGDQTRGIQWFAEHRAGWMPADEKRIIEVKRGPKSADLVLHLADGKRVLDKPLNFTFGLMAGPVKPRYSNCDMSGNRILALAAPEQMTAMIGPRAPIVVPRPRPNVFMEGCTELEFSPDWDPQNPTDREKVVELLWYGNSLGNSLTVGWNAENRALQVRHRVPDTGEQVLVCEAKVDLKKGEWYRLSWNYGKQAELYLNGVQIASGTDTIRMPDPDFWSMDQLASGGRVSLRGWRMSRAPRTAEELKSFSTWTVDPNTLHLELLQDDPTPMNVTNPVVGLPGSPAYLEGAWSYDAKSHVLTAGADEPSMTAAERMARAGVRGVIFFSWSKNILGNDGPTDTASFTKCIELCNKFGIRVLPYTLWGITNVSPDFEDAKWELSTREPEDEIPATWKERGQTTYSSSAVGASKLRNLYQIDQMMKLGCGGVYLDGVVAPDDSTNPIQGYAPVLDSFTGKRVRVSHIFDRRQYFKDMYGLVKSYRSDAIVDAHASAGFDMPIMSFVTDATNGESLGVITNWQAAVEPAVIRAEFAGRQYGFNAESLMYNNFPVPVEWAMALMGVHGQSPRDQWGMYPGRAEGLWRLVDRFDTKSAEWMPYYSPEKNAFKPGSPQTLASAFVHPGKNTLLFVANMSDEPKTENIRVDWKKLGLSPDSPIKLFSWNTPVQMKDGAIPLTFKPRQILYVWIGEEK